MAAMTYRENHLYLAVHHFGTGINLVGRFVTVSNDDILAINEALVPKKEKN